MRLNWGPIKEVWEGYAADNDLRHFASSGGAASAITLYCLKKEGSGQVVHIGPDHENVLGNRTVISKTKGQLLAQTGSRYAPASPCDGLYEVANAQTPSVFIGKPCDIQGVRKAEQAMPEIRDRVGLTVSIFCAGTPSTMATFKLIESLKVPINKVTGIRYRGRGWPGTFAVWTNGSKKPAVEIPYSEAWGFLQKYRPYRCYLCPDGTGELADISCGDPWYRETRDGGEGYSLVLLRTERGREIFHKAIREGYIKGEQVKPEVLPKSQPGFPEKRGAIWGRLLAMKVFGIPTPTYEGWPLFQCWMKLPVKKKAKSILGTAKRIIQRKYYKPIKRNGGRRKRAIRSQPNPSIQT
jgi:coenzyme F420 hydrogenase subunit beta